MEHGQVRMFCNVDGQNAYSTRNIFATQVNKVELQLIKEVLQAPLKKLYDLDGPFTIAGFGTADGAAFIEILPAVIDVIQSYCGKKKPISVVFEDGPDNDFKSICHNFLDLVKHSALQDVFFQTFGQSFYEQCMPDHSLCLSCCTTSIHWLSKIRPSVPCNQSINCETALWEVTVLMSSRCPGSTTRFLYQPLLLLDDKVKFMEFDLNTYCHCVS